MNKLNEEQLKEIKGGSIDWGIATIISGIVMFISGIFDGYVRPFACRSIV